MKTFTIEQALTLLAAAPAHLAELTAGLTEEQLHTPSGPGEWSANDVLAHLRSCADMWGGSIATILAQERPTIRAINPRTWVKRTDYPEWEFRPALEAFTAQRGALLSALGPLAPADWSRSATVTGAGKPLTLTVLDYADRLAIHERPHIKQIARIASALRI